MARPGTALRHAALGVVLGGAIGDSLGASVDGAGEGAFSDRFPVPAIGGTGELSEPWGDPTVEAMAAARHLVATGVPDFALAPSGAPLLAVFDAGLGTSPLLADPDTVVVHDTVAAVLRGESPRYDGAVDPVIAGAFACVAAGGDDVEVVLRRSLDAGGETRRRTAVVGALVGAVRGATAFPSRWVTYVHGPAGRHSGRLRHLVRMSERLLRVDREFPPDPPRSLWPAEVADGFFVSNLPGARRFPDLHPDGAIVSLCPVDGTFDDYPVRREFLLADTPTRIANPRLGPMLDEILVTVRAFRDEGRPVLVHCHHGASRTGFVLRAWLMATEGLGEWEATAEAEARWPRLSLWNDRFTEELRRRASEGGVRADGSA